MTPTKLFAAALGAGVAAGAGYALLRNSPSRGDLHKRIEDEGVIPIITPVIDISTAEYVLSRMENLRTDEVTVVLHTEGGEVTSCVMIADALRRFGKSRAIVPYMAISGGTLIALNARRLQMRPNAVLSAVDPLILGQRARHIQEKNEDGFYPLAQEYGHAVGRFLEDTLEVHLAALGEHAIERAMQVFMGESAPHSWPVKMDEVRSLGLPVEAADKSWANFVDTYRRQFPRCAPKYALTVRRR